MRTCKTCGTSAQEDFYETSAAHYCRPCFTTRYIETGRVRLFQAKMTRGRCVDCELMVTHENACVFDWDHLGEKRWNVSKMLSCSLSNFNAEIAKCDLVCANCHRIRTKKRGRRWAKGGRPRTRNKSSPQDEVRPSPDGEPPTPSGSE